jgi:hypothetical protein
MNAPEKKAAARRGNTGGEGDQHRKQSHAGGEPSTAMPPFGMRWYQYNPAFHLAATLKMSAEEKAAHYDALNTALIMGTRGISLEADRMLDNADRISKVRKDAAFKSWEARGGDANAKQLQSKSNALPNRPTDRPTDRLPEPKKGTVPESVSVRESVYKSLGIGNSRGGLKEKIAGLSHEALSQWATAYCQEADPNQAIRAHKKAIRTIGPEAFRRELDSFVAEVEAGEEPDSRGRAFMARIRALVKAKDERG